ncbi:MAG: metalloregulator ArsR/SmtB family transcription factor [Chloroflexota bacterium]|nr:metalloregulator ArsR/SmtB family transcription factor [Chloroflexota bacterium]
MPPSEQAEQFVTFFKALADKNRLKIVGLLAHKPYSVEELAANLHVTSATVSHHLKRLQRANLVEARVQSYYNVYALRVDVLRQMAERLLSVDSIKATALATDLDGYSAKVLSAYMIHRRLKTIPSQLKKREVILRRLAEEFEIGKRYSERRVNEILKAFHTDYVTLRRELVNLKLLARDNGHYWRES